MAQVIGVPGRDAVWKSHEELAKAASKLQCMLRAPRRYDEASLAQIRDAIQQPSNWIAGALGECRTGEELEHLPDDYVVFHDFHLRQPNGDRAPWNVDHIVVGPTGVFVIDSKNCRASSTPPAAKSKRTQEHVRTVQRQAMQVHDWLKSPVPGGSSGAFVQGVVVHANGHTYVEKTEEGHVWVLPLRMLRSRIEGRPHRLDLSDVASISKSLMHRRALTPADAFR